MVAIKEDGQTSSTQVPSLFSLLELFCKAYNTIWELFLKSGAQYDPHKPDPRFVELASGIFLQSAVNFKQLLSLSLCQGILKGPI